MCVLCVFVDSCVLAHVACTEYACVCTLCVCVHIQGVFVYVMCVYNMCVCACMFIVVCVSCL